jgi:hypothetical protein
MPIAERKKGLHNTYNKDQSRIQGMENENREW